MSEQAGLLAEVAGGIEPMPHRVLLCGKAGDGKSSFFSDAKEWNPIFIPIEDRLKHIACNAFFKKRSPSRCVSYGEAFSCLQTLYEAKHDYRMAVIDDLDGLEKLIHAEVFKRRGVKSMAEIDYGKGYEAATTYAAEIIAALETLRNERGMMIGITAHVQVETYKHPEKGPYDRFVPAVDKRIAATFCNWCDEVLFIAHKVNTSKTELGFDKTHTRAYSSGERVLKTTQRPTHEAKNSLNLPDELPFELGAAWSTFAQYLPKVTP